ncbi:hypothetical protein [Sphingosinithalassobacter sp. CS137]|uniref:hypothetical protein n=1 Tax=Sphingosinithalassobacter sp. CS137 TaxID=2762748 RepID=UPI00165DE71C|nr:hypothetical protein [Sphingosinithalassobacter sp. CS137]
MIDPTWVLFALFLLLIVILPILVYAFTTYEPPESFRAAVWLRGSQAIAFGAPTLAQDLWNRQPVDIVLPTGVLVACLAGFGVDWYLIERDRRLAGDA